MGVLGNQILPFNPLATSGKPRDAQRFNGDNSTTTFTLNFRVNSAVDLEVFVENVQQEPLTAYDAVANQLIFTEAPPTGSNNIYVVYRNAEPGIFASIPDGSITFNKLANNIRLFTTDNFTGDGGTTAFNLSSDVPDANTLMVAVDGVFQRAPIHYTASNSTITFASAPPVSSNVHVRHLGFRTTQTITALPANTTISQPTLESPTVTGTSTFTGNVGITGTLTLNGNLTSGNITSTIITANSIVVTTSNTSPAALNRIGTDGQILTFSKNSSVVGSVTVTSSGTTYATSSDIRLKTDIRPIENSVEKIMSINPVVHRWKSNTETQVCGFIAQELMLVVPEAVSGQPNSDEMMAVDYGRITPILVAALQEAHRKIESLEKRLNSMEKN